MTRCLAVAIAILVTVCEFARAQSFDPKDATVLSPTVSKGLLHQCSRPSPQNVTGTWTPSPAQTHALEARLPALLLAALQKLPQWTGTPGHPGHAYQPGDYVRQYAGFIAGGRRIIYVNGLLRRQVDNPNLPPQFKTDWRSQPLMVCDGGIGFFGVEYDPASGSFAHLAFNGVA